MISGRFGVITVVLALTGGSIVCDVLFLPIVEDQGVEEKDGEQDQYRARTTGRLKVFAFKRRSEPTVVVSLPSPSSEPPMSLS